MENSLVTYGSNKDREGIEHCLAICIYLHSIRKVTAKNYLKESLSSILCFIIQGKSPSRKGLILKFILLRVVI